jgi:hypothetical protein
MFGLQKAPKQHFVNTTLSSFTTSHYLRNVATALQFNEVGTVR